MWPLEPTACCAASFRICGRGTVVLIAHGHISRVIAARWIGLGALDGGRFALGTAAPSVLGGQHGQAVIDRWNLPNPAVEQGETQHG